MLEKVDVHFPIFIRSFVFYRGKDKTQKLTYQTARVTSQLRLRNAAQCDEVTVSLLTDFMDAAFYFKALILDHQLTGFSVFSL